MDDLVRQWLAEGWEEVSENGSPLWEIIRGGRYREIIKDVRIAPNGKRLYVLIGPVEIESPEPHTPGA